MATIGPDPTPITSAAIAVPHLAALLAARRLAAHHVYDAECALHYAHQAARGAAAGEEACQCDRWVAAAYTHLHAANVEYAAATAAVDVVAARGPALHAVPAPPAVPAQVVQVHAVPVHAVQVHAVQVPAIEPRAAAG